MVLLPEPMVPKLKRRVAISAATIPRPSGPSGVALQRIDPLEVLAGVGEQVVDRRMIGGLDTYHQWCHGGVVLSTATLTLPHPGMAARAFVLLPLQEALADLAPLAAPAADPCPTRGEVRRLRHRARPREDRKSVV